MVILPNNMHYIIVSHEITKTKKNGNDLTKIII
jgi:hypothetical protein